MVYEPTLEAVKAHNVPEWFHDAKLGIFVHWGLYSVPAWAPLTGELHKVIADGGWLKWFSNNPYAEWYQNSLAIGQGATYEHHTRTYGPDFRYSDFSSMFQEATQRFDPSAMAGLFKQAGARYVVLTTKHHEGFLLWPSNRPNPRQSNWQLQRDVVGELTEAVRDRDMKIGLYYSGGLDWTFNPHVVKDIADLFMGVPQSPDYEAYASGHIRELIARYQPAVLWNDIGYPALADLPSLFADYYNAVPDGVINDRFIQGKNIDPQEMLEKMARGELGLPQAEHYDFKTPEYSVMPEATPYKWESCRGLGFSFGYNQNDTEANMLSVEALVHSLVDIVSKNGNLLLNVGPRADGSISELQATRLKGLGNWLAVNGEAIYGTRPWSRAAGQAHAGGESIQTRFTHKNDALYVALLDTPQSHEVILESTASTPLAPMMLLGHASPLAHEQHGEHLAITLPDPLPVSPVHVIKIPQ